MLDGVTMHSGTKCVILGHENYWLEPYSLNYYRVTQQSMDSSLQNWSNMDQKGPKILKVVQKCSKMSKSGLNMVYNWFKYSLKVI